MGPKVGQWEAVLRPQEWPLRAAPPKLLLPAPSSTQGDRGFDGQQGAKGDQGEKGDRVSCAMGLHKSHCIARTGIKPCPKGTKAPKSAYSGLYVCGCPHTDHLLHHRVHQA